MPVSAVTVYWTQCFCFYYRKIAKCLKQLKLTLSDFQQNMSVLSIWKYSLVCIKLICCQHRSIINTHAASEDVKNPPKNGDIFKFLVYYFELTCLSHVSLNIKLFREEKTVKQQDLDSDQNYCYRDYPLH